MKTATPALLLGVLSCVPPSPAHGQATPTADAVTLDRVQVSAVPLEDVAAFDVPASISIVRLDGSASRAGISVSEALDGIPGLAARERQNFAQDTQLSIRGFGARSTFGVRGLRLYTDGIPATMPDGQGQLSHASMAGAERIEVLRGPFSALHGNSSGGVVQVWSEEGAAPMRGHVQASAGRDASHVLSAGLRDGGAWGGYALAASAFEIDGWREHGSARRESFNARLHFEPAQDARVDLVANHFASPDAQDPLGLDRAQVREDPRQAAAVADLYDTRKSVRQDQAGLRYRHAFAGGHALEAMAYGGTRAIEQFLSVPVAAQANPLSSGGNIDLDNRYAGGDLRWRWTGALAGRALQLAMGLAADRQRQHRRGYENFVDDRLGVRGALRRDERNRVGNVDRYAQAWWELADHWSLLGGVRHSRVRFASDDHYVTEANPDDSGRVTYAQTTPVLGLAYAPSAQWRLYASSGRGFETPTFNELGYRADGGAGLAFDLVPAASRNLELGGKWRGTQGASVEAALFRAETDDELAVARNVGGRSSYRNVGRARRQGAEVAAALPLAGDWHLDLAWTWLDATFRDAFFMCSGSGCTDPTTRVAAGSRIPGTTRQQFHARATWRPGAWTLAVEGIGSGDLVANDTGSARAPGFVIANLEAAHEWATGAGALRAFVRVDNLFDHAYVGSVIVNEGNGRYYEPAPGRGVLAGLHWDWQRDGR